MNDYSNMFYYKILLCQVFLLYYITKDYCALIFSYVLLQKIVVTSFCAIFYGKTILQLILLHFSTNIKTFTTFCIDFIPLYIATRNYYLYYLLSSKKL